MERQTRSPAFKKLKQAQQDFSRESSRLILSLWIAGALTIALRPPVRLVACLAGLVEGFYLRLKTRRRRKDIGTIDLTQLLHTPHLQQAAKRKRGP